MTINNWSYDLIFKKRFDSKSIQSSISFESIESKNFFNGGIPTWQIKNIEISFSNSPSNATKIVSGNSFIFSLDLVDSHYHFLANMLGQFLLIKDFVPDIKALPIMHQTDNKIKNLSDQSKISNYVYNVLSNIDVFENSVLYSKDYNKILIENLYIVDPDFSLFVDGSILPHYKQCPTNLIVEKLLLFFNPLHNATSPIKIFISRIPENSKLRKTKKKLEEKISLGKAEEEKFLKLIGEGNLIKLNHRFISFEEEKKLESFFKSQGYKIINPGGLPLEKQIKLFASATHVAGLSGAGFINTIFCPPKANVFILNTSSGYNFDHGLFPMAAGHNVFYIPEIFKSDKDIVKLDAENIICKLQEYREAL